MSLLRASLVLLTLILALGAGSLQSAWAGKDASRAPVAGPASLSPDRVPTQLAVSEPRPLAEVQTPAVSKDAAHAPSGGADQDSPEFADDGEAPRIFADPIAPWNRFWFKFNDVLYMGVFKPLAKGYVCVTPDFFRKGVGNAFDNALFPMRFLNALLQLEFAKASREFGRFFLNTTFGIGGLADVAAAMNPDLQPQVLDFGQTLGKWGMGYGFYVVWPVLGPSSLRDTFGLAGNYAMSPSSYLTFVDPWYLSFVVKGAENFNALPVRVDAYEAIRKASIEPYVATRDAYLQMRDKQVQP